MHRQRDKSRLVLKVGHIDRILVLALRQGRVVVHLQALCLHLLLLAAALAAAAAVSAAEAQGRGHHGIPRRHGVQGPRQEVPGAQDLGQVVRPAALHHVDDDDDDDQHYQRHGDADQHLPAGHGEAEHAQGHDQEAQDEIEGGEPAVLGRVVSQPSGQPNGQPHEGERVPNQDPHYVEEEMAEGNLGGGEKKENAVNFQTTPTLTVELGFTRGRLLPRLTCRELASLSPLLAMAARIAVVVVPIFEPSVSG